LSFRFINPMELSDHWRPTDLVNQTFGEIAVDGMELDEVDFGTPPLKDEIAQGEGKEDIPNGLTVLERLLV
jgi:hypothetical protein